jgi:3-phosphoshikimate 1-carboxyvinyltransferase
MMLEIAAPWKKICARIALTGSKSESNRVLVIASLCEDQFTIHDLAAARDTQVLIEVLSSLRQRVPGMEQVFDVGPAGTAMRFLTGLLAVTPGRYLLTGSERMKKRPIGILVDALRKLGAEIEYAGEFGYPPLRIKGKMLEGGNIELNPSVSSQFVSSLLMVSPVMEHGLEIHFSEAPVSRPYLQMTIEMMRYFGADVEWIGNRIVVQPGGYAGKDFCVEADWSAASYWYAVVALSEEGEIILEGLHEESLQGDAVLKDIFLEFGVETIFENGDMRIRKNKSIALPEIFRFDFSECPDFAQTLACVCAGLGIRGEFAGLQTLRIKETDRLTALKNELHKFGIRCDIPSDEELIVFAGLIKQPEEPVLTYEDHRMAMAFAPLALVVEKVEMQDPKVVEKSYPAFWTDLEHAGFEMKMN